MTRAQGSARKGIPQYIPLVQESYRQHTHNRSLHLTAELPEVLFPVLLLTSSQLLVDSHKVAVDLSFLLPSLCNVLGPSFRARGSTSMQVEDELL